MVKIEYNYKVIGKLWNEYTDTRISVEKLASKENTTAYKLGRWFSRYLKERADKGLKSTNKQNYDTVTY